MSFNIDSNLRLEFGRQRQAELLQRAQRDKLERGLLDEIANEPARCHTRRGRSCCGATARQFQGRLDDHRARTPDGRRNWRRHNRVAAAEGHLPPRRRRVGRVLTHFPAVTPSESSATLRRRSCVRPDSNMGRAGMRRFIMVTLVIAAFAVVSTAGTANASTKWPARCSNFKCVNAHLNAVHTSLKKIAGERQRILQLFGPSRSRSTPTS